MLILKLPLFLLFTTTRPQKSNTTRSNRACKRNKQSFKTVYFHYIQMLSKIQYKRHSLIFIRNMMLIESNKTEKLQNALKRVTLLHKSAVAQVQVPTHNFLKDKQEAQRNRYTMPAVLLPVGSLPPRCSPPPVLHCVSKPPSTGRNELTWGTNSEGPNIHENRRRAELT